MSKISTDNEYSVFIIYKTIQVFNRLSMDSYTYICKPTGGDASVRDAKNWMGAWDSKTKNCPADSDHLLISDTEERSVCALRDETRVVGWVRRTDSCV